MTEPSAPRRPITRRLGFQIAFLLAVVLLPLTLISVINALSARKEMRARSEVALIGETINAAAAEVRIIQQARGAAAALAATGARLVADPAACSAAMTAIAAQNPQYSLVAFIPKDGIMRCSSSGQTVDLNGEPLLATLLAAPQPRFVANANGPVSGTAVLGISHPVIAATGEFVGVISISIPQSALGDPKGLQASADALGLVTFDRTATLLTASMGLSKAPDNLPRDKSLAEIGLDGPVAFSGPSVAGTRNVYAVVPLVPGELYALGLSPAGSVAGFEEALLTVPVLFPALIWLASLAVAWLAVERLVNRHIRRLGRSFAAFMRGSRRTGDLTVGGAPVEIQEMAEAYDQMRDSVIRNEAALESTVHQKEVLLREVHHRVKNNLQLIGSIMNMYARRADTDETKALIRSLQSRVMSLATIHRELYQTVGGADVDAPALLRGITQQITALRFPSAVRPDVRTEFDDIRLTPDQAVPLALFLAEAANDAFDNLANSGQLLDMRVSLRRGDGDTANLQIRSLADGDRAPGTGDDTRETRDELGAQLLHAFAAQLGAQVEGQALDGNYSLTLVFDLRALSDAEERNPVQEPLAEFSHRPSGTE